MNPLRLEAKRFLYSHWMLPAVFLVEAGLIWYVYRGGASLRQKEPWTCLALLLSTVEYHILLYAVLAVALVGVDVSARVPRLETMAGGSPLRFLGRKAILYIAGVLVCELLCLALPLLLWGIFPGPLWRLLPVRLFLYLGIAMPLFLLQAVLPGLSSMLIGDAVTAIVWIGLHEDDLNTWYLLIQGQRPLPPRWLLPAALSVTVSFALSVVVYLPRGRSGRLS